MTDIAAARRFVQLHGRLIDRRRLDHLLDGAPAELVVSAVMAYANPDGGFAGVIEPDVRSTTSQPLGALTAFDVLGEIGAPLPAAALDWLDSVSSADGGVPWSLSTVADAPHSPWMGPQEAPSFHMTAAVADAALRAGAAHPFLERAGGFCARHLASGAPLTAYETKYALRFLESSGDREGYDRLRASVPADGRVPVRGGVEGETIPLLDPPPEEVQAGQRDDGGWDFDWLKWSPVTTFEWRARLTVDALVRLLS